MCVVCFSSLKGGVGKTSGAVNTAHALAQRGCETLLVDLDPSQAASGFFGFNARGERVAVKGVQKGERLGIRLSGDGESSVAERLRVAEVRDGLHLLPIPAVGAGGQDDRDTSSFLWNLGDFLNELSGLYDFVVVDTPPIYSLRTRVPLITAGLVIIPVDCSAMGLAAFSRLVAAASPERPAGWALLRTMVNRRASAINRLVERKLEEAFRESEAAKLFEAVIYRTESYNRLSFQRRTVFDSRATASLAKPYELLAKEIEDYLSESFDEPEKALPEIGGSDVLTPSSALPMN